MEAGGWILGTGTTSVDFQIGGTNPSLIDELKMAAVTVTLNIFLFSKAVL